MKKISITIFGLGLGLSVLQGSSLKEALENADIKGFAFGRYTMMGGNDGAGQRYQFRTKVDLISGEINGYSLTGGIFFSQGSGTPDSGNNTDNDIQGSRGVRTDMSGSDVFNINNLYINKKFSITKTSVQLGQMDIVSPFTDKSVDRGIGAFVQNSDIKGLKFSLSGYDTWMTDDIYVAAQASKIKNDSKKGAGIGNNLFIAGVDGNYDLDEGSLHHLNFKLYDLWAHHLIDYMIFGELGYKYTFAEHVYVKFMGQIAASGVNKVAGFQSKSLYLSGYFDNKVSAESLPSKPAQELANNRGLYNLQASMEIHKFYLEVGFAGSFGDGYGALLDNVGGFNTAGKVWNGSQGHGADGFGFLGSGATKNTSINALYAQMDYKIGSFILSIDGAWISGKNNYPLLSSGSHTLGRDYRGKVAGYPDKRTMDASFVEITPSIAYKVGKKITAQIYYGSVFGDISLNRTRLQITYNF
ncbi:major outer membrane protein [Helicobacter cappadocius]|uniref:Major outer membrane protein n=1 Tax=Helicobacter cappadocius TaxID=3063998 RepID=A0AA90T8V3_9HELI|nr:MULTISPECIES: major outer membrane protein [unclassified Helicobacter]MDO7252310.1 major outer membrane protein [Helicobacter sp. faydin-H75]MDP2538177.1 major outer membrane protein [Helicobacter sp. faydin-H76]